MKRTNVEAEKNELILQNESGDYAIIPANKRDEVLKLMKEGCYDCIDSIVASLPKASDYAQDGSVISNDPIYSGGTFPTTSVTEQAPNWLKFKREYEQSNPFDIEGYVNERFNNPRGRQAIDKINEQQFRQDLYNEAVEVRNKNLNTYVADKLLQTIPQNKQSRSEYLNQFSDKEQQIIKNIYPKYAPSLITDTKRGLTSLVESNPYQAFTNIINSSDYTDAEKREMLQEYINHPVMSKIGDAAKILSPLAIPSKMVQAAYKDNYTMQDAMQGTKNDAGLLEDIVTDPLNLVGAGIVGKLSKTSKVIDNVYAGLDDMKTILSKMDNISQKNIKIQTEGDKYFQSLDNPESLKRLKQFGEEYDIDLIDVYKKAVDRWRASSAITKEGDVTQIMSKDNFKVADIGNTFGVSTAKNKEKFIETLTNLKNEFGYNSPQVKEFRKQYLAKNSINYVSDKLPLEMYPETIWHELSHDINKSVIDFSPKLQKDISEIFVKDANDADLESVQKARIYTAIKYPDRTKSLIQDLDKISKLEKIAQNELKYIKRPTETWAFLSTNLRQDLMDTGVIKDYNELLTLDKLEQAIKNENTVYSRFEPYIKDKKKFVELFNKMTLTTVPIISYLQVKASNSNEPKIKAEDGLVISNDPPAGLENLLREYNSPMTVDDFMSVSKETGIGVDALVTQALLESSLGTKGKGGAGKNPLNWGNDDKGNIRTYSSYKEGLLTAAKGLKDKFYFTTPEDFIARNFQGKYGIYATDPQYKQKYTKYLGIVRDKLGGNYTTKQEEEVITQPTPTPTPTTTNKPATTTPPPINKPTPTPTQVSGQGINKPTSFLNMPNVKVIDFNAPANYNTSMIPSVSTTPVNQEKLNLPKEELFALKSRFMSQGYLPSDDFLDVDILKVAMLDNVGKLGKFDSYPIDDDSMQKLVNTLKDIK